MFVIGNHFNCRKKDAIAVYLKKYFDNELKEVTREVENSLKDFGDLSEKAKNKQLTKRTKRIGYV